MEDQPVPLGLSKTRLRQDRKPCCVISSISYCFPPLAVDLYQLSNDDPRVPGHGSTMWDSHHKRKRYCSLAMGLRLCVRCTEYANKIVHRTCLDGLIM